MNRQSSQQLTTGVLEGTRSLPALDAVETAQLLGTLWRGKWTVAACGVIAVVIAGLYAYRIAVPLYPAQVTITRESEAPQVINGIESIFSSGGTDTVALNTEIVIFESRNLVGQLVDDLRLVADPEFNEELHDPRLSETILTSLGFPPKAALSEDEQRERVIDTLTARLNVANIQQSLAFTIFIETTEPQKSVDIVNGLAEVYIENQVRKQLEAATRTMEFLSQRTSELKARVESLELDLANLTTNSSVVTEDELMAQTLQLRDIRGRLIDLDRRIAFDAATIDRISQADTVDLLLSEIEASNDPRLVQMAVAYRDGRLSETTLRSQVSMRFDQLKAALDQSRAQREALQASAESLSESIGNKSNELITLNQLEREAEAAQLLYETFLARLQEASVQQSLEISETEIVSPAVRREASSPRPILVMLLAMTLGAMAGAAVVFVREWRFAGFRTGEDLVRYTGRRVLGTIPALANRTRQSVLNHLKEKPTSVFAEAVRNLRTSVLMSSLDREPNVILVTSSVPGEGKTTLSIALTHHLNSMEGRTAILVEADVHRKTLSAYSDRTDAVTLADAVLGREDADTWNLFDNNLGFDVLVGSTDSFNGADLFASAKFKELIKQLSKKYDHIIIDAPPLLALTDARVLAKLADEIIFAVKWQSTTKTQVREGLNMLESVGHPNSALVLSQVDLRRMKKYGYDGQYAYDGTSTDYYEKH